MRSPRAEGGGIPYSLPTLLTGLLGGWGPLSGHRGGVMMPCGQRVRGGEGLEGTQVRSVRRWPGSPRLSLVTVSLSLRGRVGLGSGPALTPLTAITGALTGLLEVWCARGPGCMVPTPTPCPLLSTPGRGKGPFGCALAVGWGWGGGRTGSGRQGPCGGCWGPQRTCWRRGVRWWGQTRRGRGLRRAPGRRGTG